MVYGLTTNSSREWQHETNESLYSHSRSLVICQGTPHTHRNNRGDQVQTTEDPWTNVAHVECTLGYICMRAMHSLQKHHRDVVHTHTHIQCVCVLLYLLLIVLPLDTGGAGGA